MKNVVMSWAEPGQFHIINVQRRMADWAFEKAQTWEDLLAAHEKWMQDYNAPAPEEGTHCVDPASIVC